MYLFYSGYLDEISQFYIIEMTDYLKAILIIVTVYIICCFVINKSLKSKVDKEINALLTLRPTLIGERTLEINDEHIIVTNNKERTEQRIKGIDNIKEVDGSIILYIGKLSPVHIIPCSCSTYTVLSLWCITCFKPCNTIVPFNHFICIGEAKLCFSFTCTVCNGIHPCGKSF